MWERLVMKGANTKLVESQSIRFLYFSYKQSLNLDDITREKDRFAYETFRNRSRNVPIYSTNERSYITSKKILFRFSS